MWLLFGLMLLVCVLAWDYSLKKRRNNIFKASRIPGPSFTLPIIGDVIETIGNDTLNVFALFIRLGAKFGKVYRLWLFHRVIIVFSDPRYFQVILSSQQLIKKNFFYDMFSCWLGDGLLLSSGSKWHARRKMITPTFHFKILEGFVEVFDQQSRILVKKLAAKADGRTVCDVFPIVCLATLDIIAETAMGVKINAQEHPDFPYAKAVKTATEILGARSAKPVQYYDISFMLTAFPSFLRLRKSIKVMHDFTNKVINNRRTIRTTQTDLTEISNDLDVGQKKRMVFLDVLLQATINGKPLSQEDIREEVDTFMFEGHDTTTSAISFCLFLLSRHAQVQQKAFEEIIHILGPDTEKPITMSELQELKYLEAVIKESLRLYPSAPIIARETLENFKIGDQVLPANSSVVLLIYLTHRDPDYFHEPTVFKPERFYSESGEIINPFAYVPFSAGPRNCIGQKFAMLQLKSTISSILRNFELLPLGENVLPVLNLVQRSLNGMQLGLKLRAKIG